MSFVKPNAKSEDILMACKLYDISDTDKVILCVGEHDTNPIKLLIELGGALKALQKCTTIVLSVISSDHLRENKLNSELKLVCNNFPNGIFLNVGQTDVPLYELCRKINYEIDKFDYDKKYLSLKGLGSQNTIRQSLQKPTVLQSDNKAKLKSRTILQYFPRIEKTHIEINNARQAKQKIQKKL